MYSYEKFYDHFVVKNDNKIMYHVDTEFEAKKNIEALNNGKIPSDKNSINNNKNYVVYHLHTELSLLDSCTNHKLYTDRAVELGQTAICFTEHGNIYNWIEKKMYANSKGLKYIHGCEVYLTATLEEKIRDNYHTILIAKNYKGFQELNKLIDISTQSDHFYYKPRITFDEFFNISDNIIKISACLASPLKQYPKSEGASREIYEKLLKSYDFYEIQPHLYDEQRDYNDALFRASKQYNKPLIAATDTHSLDNYKAECRSILQKAKKIQYTDEDKFDLTYKSYNELVELFKKQAALPIDVILDAIENTNVMADMVEDFELDTSFKYPVLYDNEEEVFKKRINDMYKEKLAKGIIQKDPRYKEMVKEEMRVFKKIGMVGFMLFMSELVCWCWKNNIPVGFCRGSVGGSMIAYLTDIIDVNPITWGTVFSRFANEDRKEIGDIDIDLSPTQRHFVYEHIIEEYGADKTAYVLAIGTISDKGTIDDIARALADIHNSKGEYEIANKYSLNNTKEIKKMYEEDPDKAREEYSELFYYFDGLVGTAVSQSMHPAGIIVSPVTLPDNYGTFWNDGKRILAINMEEIHEVSLVKYDLLGLKNIEIIKDTCELAGIPYPKSYSLDWNDDDVWDHIADSPVGIFQFESQFAYDSLKKMKCRRINDLSLVNACIRPSGESYRDGLLTRRMNTNPSELINKLLEKNYGYLTFQEDVIAFLQQICGLSGSEADNVRRAIGRKQMDRLQAALPQILEGYCSKSDKPREVAEEEAKAFLKIIEDSSNYMFGYNHSTGYSMIGYTCAYLRYHYPCEFITAYLNNANNDDDINMGTELAKQLGIKIVNIQFRYSQANYSCDPKKKKIYKGLASIKYMSESVSQELYDLRDNKYSRFILLLKDINSKTTCDSRQLDILIKLDFFREFGDINLLLKTVELYNKLGNAKILKKNKVGDIPEYILSKYCKETEKQWRIEDCEALLNEVMLLIKDKTPKCKVSDRIKWELEFLGYINLTIPDVNDNYYYVQKMYDNKVSLYCIKTGETSLIKFRKKDFMANPFMEEQIIKVKEIRQEKKWKLLKDDQGNEILDSSGKKQWIRLDEYEDILGDWIILKK